MITELINFIVAPEQPVLWLFAAAIISLGIQMDKLKFFFSFFKKISSFRSISCSVYYRLILASYLKGKNKNKSSLLELWMWFPGLLLNTIIFLISLLKTCFTRSPMVNGTTLGQLWLWVSLVSLPIRMAGTGAVLWFRVVPVFGITVHCS